VPNGSEVGSAGAIGLTVGLSLMHAALPNHWLPFVLVGRSLKWTRRKTLSVVALAGGGHVLATSGLGVVVWFLGKAAIDRFRSEDVERFGARIAGTLLIVLGLVYILRHLLGGHGHSHAHGAEIYRDEHEHHHGEPGHVHTEKKIEERGAILTLFLAMTFSPCEAVVAAFVSGFPFGLAYVLGLALALSLVTVLAMFVLTWLTLAGRDRLRFPWLDRNEMSFTGVILVAIGVFVLLVPA
jgi:ABC-type nickel/cobalt efflux system permease component RcnA